MTYEEYHPLIIFLIVGFLFGGITLLLNRFLRAKKENPIKLWTYECGESPIGEAHIQLHFQYYIFAILFLVVDILSIFLFIWAVNLHSWLSSGERLLEVMPLGIMLFFIIVVTIGVYYTLRRELKIWI